MKIWIAGFAAAMALNSASAQLLSPESLQYSLLGALIGGSVGGDYHCGYYSGSGENAAIGAGVGLVFGTLLGEARRQQSYSAPTTYTAAPAYGYGYAPAPAPAPVYRSAPSRPNYAVGGTLLGAASGALIGEGTSGKPGQGAAIGAAAGLVLGGLAEHTARKQESASAYASRQPLVVTGPVAPTAPASAPRSVWTSASAPRYQIADAPRVPDAPTF